MDYKSLLFLEPTKDCLPGVVPVLSFQVPVEHNQIFYPLLLSQGIYQACLRCLPEPLSIISQTCNCPFCLMPAWDLLCL